VPTSVGGKPGIDELKAQVKEVVGVAGSERCAVNFAHDARRSRQLVAGFLSAEAMQEYLDMPIEEQMRVTIGQADGLLG
jgi:hypothetical protein